MKINPIITSVYMFPLVAVISGNVNANPQIAAKYGNPDCTLCHTSIDGGENNLRPGVLAAYDKDPKNLTALRQLLEGGSAGTANTNPTLSPIGSEWDAEIGQTLSIPLSVNDKEQDNFKIIGKYPNGAFSAEYTADNNLPTVDYQFTPSASDAYKVYKVKFQAQETDTQKKYKSNAVQAKIRVWPAGDKDLAYIYKWAVSTAKWQNGQLALKGKAVLNKMLTTAEKSAFFARNDFVTNVTQGADGQGVAIATAQPINFDPQGNWSLSLPLAEPFACSLTVEFLGKNAARKIAGAPKTCLK